MEITRTFVLHRVKYYIFDSVSSYTCILERKLRKQQFDQRRLQQSGVRSHRENQQNGQIVRFTRGSTFVYRGNPAVLEYSMTNIQWFDDSQVSGVNTSSCDAGGGSWLGSQEVQTLYSVYLQVSIFSSFIRQKVVVVYSSLSSYTQVSMYTVNNNGAVSQSAADAVQDAPSPSLK